VAANRATLTEIAAQNLGPLPSFRQRRENRVAPALSLSPHRNAPVISGRRYRWWGPAEVDRL